MYVWNFSNNLWSLQSQRRYEDKVYLYFNDEQFIILKQRYSAIPRVFFHFQHLEHSILDKFKINRCKILGLIFAHVRMMAIGIIANVKTKIVYTSILTTSNLLF